MLCGAGKSRGRHYRGPGTEGKEGQVVGGRQALWERGWAQGAQALETGGIQAARRSNAERDRQQEPATLLPYRLLLCCCSCLPSSSGGGTNMRQPCKIRLYTLKIITN